MNVNPRVTAALEPSLGDGTSNRRNTTCTRRDSNPRLGVEWTIYIPPVHPRREKEAEIYVQYLCNGYIPTECVRGISRRLAPLHWFRLLVNMVNKPELRSPVRSSMGAHLS